MAEADTSVTTATTAAADQEETYTSAALNARELEWANNSPELLDLHRKINGPVIRTRYVCVNVVVGVYYVCMLRGYG
jgi:hypothetical protein